MEAVRSSVVAGSVSQHAVRPDASAAPVIALATNDPMAILYDVRTGSGVHRLHTASPEGLCTVAWSPEHSWLLASGGHDGRVLLWDVRSARGALAELDHLADGQVYVCMCVCV
jgi:WD40 repeat protein